MSVFGCCTTPIAFLLLILTLTFTKVQANTCEPVGLNQWCDETKHCTDGNVCYYTTRAGHPNPHGGGQCRPVDKCCPINELNCPPGQGAVCECVIECGDEPVGCEIHREMPIYTALDCNQDLSEDNSDCITFEDHFGESPNLADELVIPCGVCINMSNVTGELDLSGGLNVVGKLYFPSGRTSDLTIKSPVSHNTTYAIAGITSESSLETKVLGLFLCCQHPNYYQYNISSSSFPPTIMAYASHSKSMCLYRGN